MRTRQVSSSSNSASSRRHRTVLLHEAVQYLALTPRSVVLDGTLGAAGHAKEITGQLDPSGVYIGMDADQSAILAGRRILAGVQPRVILMHENFRHAERALVAEGIGAIDAALFDLGWRAEQLEGGRGFSFQEDGPLLMTYDATPPTSALTAREIVNTWSEESLADVIYGWGQERHARRIAHAIVEARAEQPIETTRALSEVIERVVPRRGRLHPATKTFQALRIAVNDEYGALKEGLAQALRLLKSGGRMVVITFHSGEDRLVKNYFREVHAAGQGTILTKRPIAPTREEVLGNPRSRSAKLRAFEKI